MAKTIPRCNNSFWWTEPQLLINFANLECWNYSQCDTKYEDELLSWKKSLRVEVHVAKWRDFLVVLTSLHFRKYYDICKAKKDSIYKHIKRNKKVESKQKSKSLIIIVFHHLIRTLKRYSQSFVTFVTCFLQVFVST